MRYEPVDLPDWSGRYSAAVRAVEAGAGDAAVRSEIRLLASWVLPGVQSLRRAVELLRSADADDLDALLLEATIAHRTGDMRLHDELVERVLVADPAHVPALLVRIDRARQRNLPFAADLERLRDSGTESDVAVVEARHHYNDQRYAQAWEAVEAVARDASASPWAFVVRVDLLRLMGYSARAEMEARSLVERLPYSPVAWGMYAYALVARGHRAQAAEAAVRAIEVGPGEWWPYLPYGAVALSAREWDNLSAALEYALDICPEQPDVLLALADLRFRQRRRSEAGELLDRYVATGVRRGFWVSRGRLRLLWHLARRAKAAVLLSFVGLVIGTGVMVSGWPLVGALLSLPGCIVVALVFSRVVDRKWVGPGGWMAVPQAAFVAAGIVGWLTHDDVWWTLAWAPLVAVEFPILFVQTRRRSAV